MQQLAARVSQGTPAPPPSLVQDYSEEEEEEARRQQQAAAAAAATARGYAYEPAEPHAEGERGWGRRLARADADITSHPARAPP